MKFRTKLLTAVLCFAVTAGALAGCGKQTIDGTATAVTVNGESATMGTLAFYTRYEQAAMYAYSLSLFGGSGSFFDMEIGEEDEGQTYGESLRETAVNELEDLLILSQHAEEYGVSLTDEEKTELDTIAQSYIDGNEESVREQIGASKEDVVRLEELLKIREKMLAPMTDSVDRDVTVEEAQQSSLTYSRIARGDDETVAEGEEDVPDESSQAYQDAVTFLQQMIALGDEAADADMAELADEVNEDFGTATGRFTTNDPSDTYLNEVIVEAVQGLSDGEMVDHVIATEDAYYVVRMDLNYDEERTESQISTLIGERRQELYNAVLDGWREEAEITVNEDAVRTLTVTDAQVFTMSAGE